MSQRDGIDRLGAVDLSVELEIILDLSRLLSRVLHPMPTGVDRVEMAYARHLIARIGPALKFAALNPAGIYGRLDNKQVVRFLDRTEKRWKRSSRHSWLSTRMRALRDLWLLRPRRTPRAPDDVRRYYVQASPHHLHRPDVVERKLRRERAKFICLVHDLIPIEYPEYARPNGSALHRVRMDTLLKFAEGLVTNSHSTALSVAHFAGDAASLPALKVAHLGMAPIQPPQHGAPRSTESAKPETAAQPYFIIVSTIEPRKNHILLLNVWRRLIEEYGTENTPHLVVVGRRGWENENVIDMLERCDALQGHVFEYSGLSDEAIEALIRNARALLLPSFAEGFGMPVTEALALGTPVICSDLPSLREAGCDIPDYIDPLDGPAWISAVLDYCKTSSDMRGRQIERMGKWRMPTWDKHLDIVLKLIQDIDTDMREDAQ